MRSQTLNTSSPHHVQESTKPLTLINISHHNTIKLTSTNYLSWKLQIEALHIGYDLQKFIDGSYPCPPATLTANNTTASNPDYHTWLRQDKLISSTLVGTLTPSVIPLIQQAKTCYEAWTTLANTYTRPSRGHIKQTKEQLKHATKNSQTITEYMQFIKTRANELAILGKPMDDENLIEKILDGLDDEYKSIVNAIEGRETTISFDKLHEKLINKEFSLRTNQTTSWPLPASANPENTRSNSGHNRSSLPLPPSPPPPALVPHGPSATPRTDHPPPCPYQGKCPGCRARGHTTQQCPLHRLLPLTPNSTQGS